nr:MAG TPA: hypothetical protein [Caudoviricetes sp.]
MKRVLPIIAKYGESLVMLVDWMRKILLSIPPTLFRVGC